MMPRAARGNEREMIRSAADKGLKAFGLSGHGYTPYDESYCMLPEDEAAYEGEIRALAEEYAGRMEVLCGVEQDCLAGKPARDWDYVVGSVHYIDCSEQGGGIVVIDESREIWLDIVDRYFGGDIYAFAEEYYRQLAQVRAATGCGVIGHFDIVAKFNEGGTLFDEDHPRYVAAWQKAADALLQTGALFEINTGGIARKWRSVPYPAPPIVDYLAARGARFLLSGDAHRPDGLRFGFDGWGAWARGRGAVIVDAPDFCIH